MCLRLHAKQSYCWGNCVCLHTKQSYYRVGVVFSFYVAKENAFPSESKRFARVIFHWTLTCIIPLVQCLLLATGRVECKHRSLSHLRSRKRQHSHFTPDSLDWDLPQTCLPGMTFMLHKKIFINFGFHSGERNGKEKTNSAVWENCFLVSSNTG